ncbi:amino acid permease, partial [Acidianus sp. RZ1]|uniref:amino acid permease n=1 Tax=Acidianus sp. RZ1 TaxID=1540082 RepID=UPI001491B4E9
MSRNLFVRESSGLSKEVGILDSIMLNLGNMSAGVALFNSISPYISQGGIVWLAAILGLVFTLPQAYIYMYLTGRIHRTGGDYVWISRLLNGPLGIVMAFALMIESTAVVALTACFFSSAVSEVLTTIGTMNGISSLVSLSNTISSSIYSYLLGGLLFAFIIAFNIFKAKWGYMLVTIGTIVSLITTFVAMIVIGINIPHFSTSISPFLHYMKIAPPPGFASRITPFSFISTLLILPLLAIFTYPWMQATPAVAS